jgi:UDP-glucose 4,6-dehydratase
MRKVVITGGAGFIGSHVVENVARALPDSTITILDKMTYAADYENISHLIDHRRIQLVVGDICDLSLCQAVLTETDLLLHLAAESHVDNSFGDSLLFTQTNTLGTHTLLEACRINGVKRVVHVSTDEVYGEILEGEVAETASLNPTNPYSASKASAEMVVLSYLRSFKVPIVVVRANNIFGIRQFPEKLIPRACLSLIHGKKIPIHGDGSYRRRYLAAEDFADALTLVTERGGVGEIYNVGSHEEYSNLAVVDMVCREFGVKSKDHIAFVSDRPFNDQRYGISSSKIEALGWRPRLSLESEVGRVLQWYRTNVNRYGAPGELDQPPHHRAVIETPSRAKKPPHGG